MHRASNKKKSTDFKIFFVIENLNRTSIHNNLRNQLIFKNYTIEF